MSLLQDLRPEAPLLVVSVSPDVAPGTIASDCTERLDWVDDSSGENKLSLRSFRLLFTEANNSKPSLHRLASSADHQHWVPRLEAHSEQAKDGYELSNSASDLDRDACRERRRMLWKEIVLDTFETHATVPAGASGGSSLDLRQNRHSGPFEVGLYDKELSRVETLEEAIDILSRLYLSTWGPNMAELVDHSAAQAVPNGSEGHSDNHEQGSPQRSTRPLQYVFEIGQAPSAQMSLDGKNRKEREDQRRDTSYRMED